MYEFIFVESPYGEPLKVLTRTDSDGTVWSIPEDEANSDYQAYLLWLEEQK